MFLFVCIFLLKLFIYAYGSSSTKWGALRTQDDHPNPYVPFWIEIGNEQHLTTDFVGAVQKLSATMADKAKELQLPFTLSFCVGGKFT
jgi:alpha-L-arabinofuranosidase